MATYCFKCKSCGARFEKELDLKTLKWGVKCKCGYVASRDYRSEHSSAKSGNPGWPMLSDGCGVAPSQIGEAKETLRRKGVRCDFAPDGRARLESHAHRKQVLKAMGLGDKVGYY